MIALTVSIEVLPEHIDAFIAATLANAHGARSEPGNLRFDVLRAEDNPQHFTLYEVYASAEALAAHRETPHYQRWLADVTPWMALPRTRVISQLLFFGDAAIH
jgi:autoinducer 2-degrading protein